jgi:asparagine synthase (glutamine-hydrolysing)
MQKIIDAFPARSQEDMYLRFLTQWDVPFPDHADPEWQPPEGLGFAEKMMYRDALSYLPDDVLVKVDRAAMAVSLECRAPLLDRKIYEYAWRLPEKYKIRHVPPNLTERPKQGFSVPVDAWLRGPLREWAAELLNGTDETLFNKKMILETWQEHVRGDTDHGQKLWTALMFLAWRRRWL